MTVPFTPTIYTRKPPQIEAMFFGDTEQQMLLVVDWLDAIVDQDISVHYTSTMGGGVTLNDSNGNIVLYTSAGQYICKDANGKLFVMAVDVLKALYDPVD